jgi:hypothetical protein
MSQGAHPNFFSFHCFHFGLVVESIKELDGASNMVQHKHEIILKATKFDVGTVQYLSCDEISLIDNYN